MLRKIKKTDKILCVCEGGNSRSVALAWLFKKSFGMEAISVGLRESSKETLTMLGKWADHIILTDRNLKDRIPKEWKPKLRVYHSGPDIYFKGFAETLINKFLQYLEDDGIKN